MLFFYFANAYADYATSARASANMNIKMLVLVIMFVLMIVIVLVLPYFACHISGRIRFRLAGARLPY